MTVLPNSWLDRGMNKGYRSPNVEVQPTLALDPETQEWKFQALSIGAAVPQGTGTSETTVTIHEKDFYLLLKMMMTANEAVTKRAIMKFISSENAK